MQCFYFCLTPTLAKTWTATILATTIVLPAFHLLVWPRTFSLSTVAATQVILPHTMQCIFGHNIAFIDWRSWCCQTRPLSSAFQCCNRWLEATLYRFYQHFLRSFVSSYLSFVEGLQLPAACIFHEFPFLAVRAAATWRGERGGPRRRPASASPRLYEHRNGNGGSTKVAAAAAAAQATEGAGHAESGFLSPFFSLSFCFSLSRRTLCLDLYQGGKAVATVVDCKRLRAAPAATDFGSNDGHGHTPSRRIFGAVTEETARQKVSGILDRVLVVVVVVSVVEPTIHRFGLSTCGSDSQWQRQWRLRHKQQDQPS